VTITFRVDESPTVLFPDTEVSLVQTVDSVDVAAKRIPIVPNVEPKMVVSVRPVVARMRGTALDNTATSYDNMSDNDPDCNPAVTTNVLVLDLPAATKHIIVESELQIVVSHCVLPVRPVAVCSTFPKPLPNESTTFLEKDGALALFDIFGDGRS
jgi:hypothetical protein